MGSDSDGAPELAQKGRAKGKKKEAKKNRPLKLFSSRGKREDRGGYKEKKGKKMKEERAAKPNE